jgi:hypothetical protein
MKIKLIILLIMALSAHYFWQKGRPVTHEGKGQVAKDQPRQTLATSKIFRFREEYTVQPLADFEITARVLSRKRYWLGTEADLSPVDLALGWGPMSDDKVLSKLKISQSGRWFHWRCDSLPIPRMHIEQNAANMHLIPADDNIEKMIKSAKIGNIVRFKGHLVKISKQDGWRWQSSVSRSDAGNGACEVVFVKEFLIQK